MNSRSIGSERRLGTYTARAIADLAVALKKEIRNGRGNQNLAQKVVWALLVKYVVACMLMAN